MKIKNNISSAGRYRTKSLFWELRTTGDNPKFTTKSEDIIRDGITYLSLKKIYMSYDHVPGYEYDFALEVLGSWEQWTKLVNAGTDVSDLVKSWRSELDIRLKAKGIKAIMKHALDDDPKGLQAAKYLVDKGYAVKKVGRPSSEEVERELKIDARAAKQQQIDMDRIGLKIIKGDK